MAAFVVALSKWGKGIHAHHIVGVTATHEIAQLLMVKKFLLHLKLHGKLREHRFLHFNREFQQEVSLDLGDIRDHAGVLQALIQYQLSDGNKICVHHGEHGFEIKIKEVPFFNEETVHEAPAIWAEELAEKLHEKHEKLAHVKNMLSEFLEKRNLRALSPRRLGMEQPVMVFEEDC
jgi:hypothetical protein